MDDQNTEPMVDETQVEYTEPTKHLSAPVIALLALALVAVLGLLYWWFASMQTATVEPTTPPIRPTAEQNNEPESTTAEAQAGSFFIMSTSDEIDTIEADLESTDLDSLESELGAIEAEIEAATEAEAE